MSDEMTMIGDAKVLEQKAAQSFGAYLHIDDSGRVSRLPEKAVNSHVEGQLQLERAVAAPLPEVCLEHATAALIRIARALEYFVARDANRAAKADKPAPASAQPDPQQRLTELLSRLGLTVVRR